MGYKSNGILRPPDPPRSVPNIPLWMIVVIFMILPCGGYMTIFIGPKYDHYQPLSLTE